MDEECPEADDVSRREHDDVYSADGPPQDAPRRVGGEEEGDGPGQHEVRGGGGNERDVGEGQPAPAAAVRREQQQQQQQRHRRGGRLCRGGQHHPVPDGPHLGDRGASRLGRRLGQPRRLHA